MTTRQSLVITRPRHDGQKIARLLTDQGFRCILAPVLAIRPVRSSADTLISALQQHPQAILCTSKHALLTLAKLTDRRDITVLAVGAATARAARQMGFANVSCAHGNAYALVAACVGRFDPAGGRLLYCRGRDVTLNIAAALARYGFSVDTVTLYRADLVKTFPEALCDALTAHSVKAVLLFSQRSARQYAALAEQYGLAQAHEEVEAWCMSPAIVRMAETLLPWKKCYSFSSVSAITQLRLK